MTRYVLWHPERGYLAEDEDSTTGSMTYEQDATESSVLKFDTSLEAEYVRVKEGWRPDHLIVPIEEERP